MEYKFLFYTEQYAEDFLRNIEENVVVDNGATIFFIEPTEGEGESKVFWAGTSMEEVISGLGGLKEHMEIGSKVSISCGEDKTNPGQMDKALSSFTKNGGLVTYHNIGYKTNNLDCNYPFDLPIAAEIEDTALMADLINDTLGKDKFDMDPTEFKTYLTQPDKCSFIIKSNDKIIGLILGHIYNEGKQVFIRGLAVDENHRGQGYSKQLLSRLFSWAKDKGVQNTMLWVESDNATARALYEKCGYYPYGDQEAIISWEVK